MMQSISHWGQFEIIRAPGTENFREQINPADIKTTWQLPTSFFVSRQDTTYQRNEFGPELK